MYKKKFQIKYIFFILSFIWILNFFCSFYKIPPNVDDAWYFIQSFFFSHTNELAYKDSSISSYYDFSKFPVFPFIKGIFFKIILFLKIPINFYTYRLFTLIVFIFLIYSCFKLLETFFKKKEDSLIYKILFLAIIPLTPLSLNFMIVRPELLGLSFLILGILNYKRNLMISGFFISLSVFTHPMFFLINFFIIFFFTFYNFKIKNSIRFCLGLFIPFITVSIYYAYHLPHSIEHLMINSSGFPYFGYFFSYIKGIFTGENIFMNLINSYYHIPYFIIFLYLSFFYLEKVLKKKKFDYFEKIHSILIFSIFITFFLERSTYYNHSVFSILILLIFFYKFISFKINLKKIIIHRIKFFLFFSFLSIFSWNIFHTLKFFYFKNQYLYNPNFMNFKNTNLKNKQIVITRSEFIPYFIDELNLNFDSNFNKSNIDWFFPNASRAITLNEVNISKNIIKEKYLNKNTNSYWIIAKKNILNINDQDICIRIDLISPENIDLLINNYSINYETKKYIVLNSKEISLECEI